MEVQQGYFKAVEVHRMLTDAYARKQQRKAVHIKDLVENPPWEKFKGITLTTVEGNRLNESGTLIDDDTPSYPLNRYPSLEVLRAGIARTHMDQQERKEEGPSPTPQEEVQDWA